MVSALYLELNLQLPTRNIREILEFVSCPSVMKSPGLCFMALCKKNLSWGVFRLFLILRRCECFLGHWHPQIVQIGNKSFAINMFFLLTRVNCDLINRVMYNSPGYHFFKTLRIISHCSFFSYPRTTLRECLQYLWMFLKLLHFVFRTKLETTGWDLRVSDITSCSLLSPLPHWFFFFRSQLWAFSSLFYGSVRSITHYLSWESYYF